MELKILKKIALISSPENDLMLTDDLLNKYRQTPPSSDCQILDDSCNHTLSRTAPDPD